MSTESYKAGYIDGAAAELHYKQRCEQLEGLCRDLYREGCYYWLLTNNDPPYARSAWCDDFCSRMDELGLLEVDE